MALTTRLFYQEYMDVKHLALYLAKTVIDDNIVPSTTNAFRPQGQAPPSTKVLGGPLQLHSMHSALIEHLLYAKLPLENKIVD